MSNFYEVTGAKLEDLAKAAYALSAPCGLGHLHYQPGDLCDSDLHQLLKQGRETVPLSMDYVNGRCCKFHVYRFQERLFIRSAWYDHTDEDLQALLKRIGKSDAPLVEKLPQDE